MPWWVGRFVMQTWGPEIKLSGPMYENGTWPHAPVTPALQSGDRKISSSSLASWTSQTHKNPVQWENLSQGNRADHSRRKCLHVYGFMYPHTHRGIAPNPPHTHTVPVSSTIQLKKYVMPTPDLPSILLCSFLPNQTDTFFLLLWGVHQRRTLRHSL